MASIPVAGYPAAQFFGPPGKSYKGPKALPKGQLLMLVGTEQLEDELLTLLKNAGPLKLTALNEIGLFGEAETKIRTPVDYGVLRASIGHATPGDIQPGSTETLGPDDPVWELTPASVTWGTNIHYAPWIEDGFTMHTRRAVWFDDIQGFRMVDPFSYRGAHMFAAAVQVTEKAVVPILTHWLTVAIGKSGL